MADEVDEFGFGEDLVDIGGAEDVGGGFLHEPALVFLGVVVESLSDVVGDLWGCVLCGEAVVLASWICVGPNGSWFEPCADGFVESEEALDHGGS